MAPSRSIPKALRPLVTAAIATGLSLFGNVTLAVLYFARQFESPESTRPATPRPQRPRAAPSPSPVATVQVPPR